jgi:hypothetical protein
MSYISAQELRLSLGPVTYMAIFDDDRTKNVAIVDASDQVALALSDSFAIVASFMPSIYDALPVEGDTSPVLLRAAQLLFAKYWSYQRHPEYVKTYGAEPGGKLWTLGVELMKRIQAAEQQIPSTDNPPQQYTGNDGGIVYDDSPKISVPSEVATRNTALGDW